MRRARATIRLDLASADVDPAVVAQALAPDDTPQMTSRLEAGRLETRVKRESVGGLRSTVDDYVVNCRVATRVAATASATPDTDDEPDSDDDGDERDDDRTS